MADKNPLDEIVDDLVVFRHEDPNHPDGEYFSNNPLWNDSRIRELWLARHTGKPEVEEDPSADTDDEDLIPYTEMTNEQLRTELASRELSVEGKKVELIARLEQNDAEAAEEE